MMKNKQVKQMMWTLYAGLFNKFKEIDKEEKRVWAFDRLRLCESGFDRKKLRFQHFSVVSITAMDHWLFNHKTQKESWQVTIK
ncbi:MAG: hypothetical protein AAGJ17_00015 [Pseudomonadota bacterium]